MKIKDLNIADLKAALDFVCETKKVITETKTPYENDPEYLHYTKLQTVLSSELERKVRGLLPLSYKESVTVSIDV